VSWIAATMCNTTDTKRIARTSHSAANLAPQEGRVCVHGLRPAKDEEVARQVPDEEDDHDDATDRHDHLLPDGRAPETPAWR
jgi:hypothetical protein